MSCQFTWNYDDYKINNRFSKENIISTFTTPVNFSGIENNTLNELRAFMVIDVSRTFKGDFDEFQENYNITVSNGNNTIGSLYAVHFWKQVEKPIEVKAFVKNVVGTVSAKGILSKFNNGTVFFEFDNDTGKRCLTFYEKN